MPPLGLGFTDALAGGSLRGDCPPSHDRSTLGGASWGSVLVRYAPREIFDGGRRRGITPRFPHERTRFLPPLLTPNSQEQTQEKSISLPSAIPAMSRQFQRVEPSPFSLRVRPGDPPLCGTLVTWLAVTKSFRVCTHTHTHTHGSITSILDKCDPDFVTQEHNSLYYANPQTTQPPPSETRFPPCFLQDPRQDLLKKNNA